MAKCSDIRASGDVRGYPRRLVREGAQVVSLEESGTGNVVLSSVAKVNAP